MSSGCVATYLNNFYNDYLKFIKMLLLFFEGKLLIVF